MGASGAQLSSSCTAGQGGTGPWLHVAGKLAAVATRTVSGYHRQSTAVGLLGDEVAVVGREPRDDAVSVSSSTQYCPTLVRADQSSGAGTVAASARGTAGRASTQA